MKMASLRATQMSNLSRMNALQQFSTFSKGGFRATLGLKKPMAAQDNFINGSNAVYVDSMYEQWLEDPTSVHSSW